MDVNIWQKKKIIIYIGGDPEKNQPPIFTIEIESPQIKFDTNKNVLTIIETK
jgi:hypothetical protein